MRILLSGPPSSGKSTQGRRLAAALGIPHVSSGDLIRSAAARGAARDVELLRLVSDGSLAPSAAISQMVAERLALPDCADGYLLDGFPRRRAEASFIASLHPIDVLLVLEADRGTLLARIRMRAAAGRADDDPAHFPRRIEAFERETREAHRALARYGIPVLSINANSSPEVTASRLEDALASFAPGDPRSLRFA
jgi:adenylate kinase